MAAPTPLQAFSSLPRESAHEAPSGQSGEQMTGAQALVRALADLGVTDVFGIPGGQILPVFDAIYQQTKFRFILARHEQAAGHAAEGYALATGNVGTAIVTSGPGATNIVTAIADAQMDSVPIVVITGQVGTSAIGTDAFQEADTLGITYPVAKHSYLVTAAQDVPRVLAEAYYIAGTGRPGPVVIDFTKSAQNETMSYSWPPEKILPGYNPVEKAHGRVLDEAVALLARSTRPVLYVGGGAVRSDAGEQVQRLAELTDTPIVTTLPARGIVPESDRHVLGMPGMHGTVAAVGAIQHCDLLVAIGTRFDDRVTGQLATFAPDAKVIHLDIDPAEIGKNHAVDVPIVGDVATVLDDLIPLIEAAQASEQAPDLSAWWAQLDQWARDYPMDYEEPPTPGGEGIAAAGETATTTATTTAAATAPNAPATSATTTSTGSDSSDTPATSAAAIPLAPQWVIKQLSRRADPATIWVTGVGQHQMWASQFIDFERPHSWISSGGLGTMGYGLPAAIGAVIGSQREFGGRKPVWLIDGDGSFQMTSEELATAFQESLPLKIALINNSVYGMVRQWQSLFYQNHYSATNLYDGEGSGHALPDQVAALDGRVTPLADKQDFDVPDFVKLADAYGCVGLRARTKDEALAAIDLANSVNDRPVLIDFRVWKDAMVWPMVSAGESNDTIVYRPGVTPLLRQGGNPANPDHDNQNDQDKEQNS